MKNIFIIFLLVHLYDGNAQMCPLKNGVIYERVSPTLFSTGDPNNQIIIGSEFPEVYSVSAGKVVAVISIPEGEKAILIKTENVEQKDYFYVYFGLEKVNFRKGDIVQKNEVLGELKNKGNKYQLRFDFRKGAEKLDPKNGVKCEISKLYE